MAWSIRLPDGLTLKRDTRGQVSKGELRAKARRQADELMASYGRTGSWTTADRFEDYIKREALPTISANERLRGNTSNRYALCLKIAGEELGGYTIADALRPSTFGRALCSIAEKHGTTSARQVRKVVNRWVIQPLIMSDVIPSNPISGLTFELPEHNAGNKPKGGHGLTEREWTDVLDWLLADDWRAILDEGAPVRGRYTREQRANARRSIIELTALQAASGLRIGEARTLTWDRVSDDCSTLEVTDENSKTHRGRFAPVLDRRVRDMLTARRADLGTIGLVFPSPAADDPDRIWDKSNCAKAVRSLYTEIADACGVETLRSARSHVWRTTLHTIARDRGIPMEMRAALFGHDPDTARRYYTDTNDVSGVSAAFQR